MEANYIPKHWQIKRLGEVFTIERGGSPRPIEDFITTDENGINWIKIGDTKDVVKYIHRTKEKIKPEGAKKSRMVFEDDFLLSNSMSFGRPYIMKTTGCIHDGWLVIRKNETIDNNYLYYILSSSLLYQQFSNLAKGSTVKNLNIEAVSQAVIKFPPLHEQQAIVSKIEELLSDLENGKQQLQTAQQQLKVYRQSLLKWAFEGKLTNEGVKDGQLPKGWKWVKFNDFCKLQRGHDLPLAKIEKGIYPVVTSAGVNGYHNEFRANGPCLTSGRSGSVGNINYIEVEKYWPHNTVLFAKDFCGNIPKFVYYFFKQFNFKSFSASTAVPTLDRKQLFNELVPVPLIEEQQLIVDELESKLTVCDKIEETISKSLLQAETLRQSILKKAFEGKLV